MDYLQLDQWGKHVHSCLVIVYAGSLKKVHKGKSRKEVVTECNQDLIIKAFRQKHGSGSPWTHKHYRLSVKQRVSFIT